MTRLLANRKSRDRSKNAAQVGIGTLIVFIATVLVAAIAAAVLIDTSGKLQERSSRTGDQATKQVASNLNVERVVGDRWSGSSGVKVGNVSFYMTLAPGASSVDLKQIKIRIGDGDNLQTVKWNDKNNTADWRGFSITEVRDEDNSIGATLGSAPNTTSAVMTSGDLVYLKVNLAPTTVFGINKGINMELDVRKEVFVTLSPEVGAPVQADFITPESFGKAKQISLR